MKTEYDVVIAGSGAAGLTAALAAAAAGRRVAVFEAASRWGGSTGISGGAVWVPGNHLIEGPDEGARDYCVRHAHGRDPALVDAFLTSAPAMVRFVEAHSPITFTSMQYPDTFAESVGGSARGRHLEPAPLKVGELGPWDELAWPMPYPPVLTNDEVFGGGVHGGAALPYPLLQQRMEADEVTMGLALIVGLLGAATAAGVDLFRNARVEQLVVEDGRVRGVVVTADGQTHRVVANDGVVLANGGYESNPEVSRRLLGTPEPMPIAPPVNFGDALRLAASAGAELAHLGESWCWPAVQVPGEVWEIAPEVARPQMIVSERTMPHVLWVNRHGRRFVNEASHNCALGLADIDPQDHGPRHQPVWAIGDAQFRAKYTVAGVGPDDPAPEWLLTADSVAELADKTGLPAAELQATLDRFNDFVAAGRDEDFGRGDTIYDRYTGDPGAPHPTLGTVAQPPFFALPVHRGTIASKGGVRTDGSARALRWDGTPVPGLFAAGTAAAALFGPGAIANGMHLGFALTWGWLAGTTATGA